MLRLLTLTTLVVLMLGACSGAESELDAGEYRAFVEDWRAQRLASLKGPTGYLNLAGLYWLPEGISTFGSASDNDLVLPAKAAPRVGTLELTDSGVVLVTEPGVEVLYEGIPVRSLLLADDHAENPVTITHGSLAWMIIRREDRYAMRLRDFEHPAIEAFPPLEYYPIDRALRVEAQFAPYAEPRVINVDTVIEGLGWQPQSPGEVVFELDGETHRLETYDSGEQLFIVFGDRTSGRETYPAGRFLYADKPVESDTTILDFNLAYNPPCAFNDFATCPVASPKNRLSVAIAAGERFDPSVHFTPDGAH